MRRASTLFIMALAIVLAAVLTLVFANPFAGFVVLVVAAMGAAAVRMFTRDPRDEAKASRNA